MFILLLLTLLNILFFSYGLVLLLLVAFLVLLERNVLGLIQIRNSPNIVGLWGLVQTVIDSINLLIKHFFINNNNFFFYGTPVLGLVLSFLHWIVVPIPYVSWGSHMSILYSFVIMGVIVFVVLWSGWSSKSGYGLVGCVRSVAQIVSYEVVFIFFLFCFIISNNDYDWGGFIQDSSSFSGYLEIFLCTVWIVLVLSELNRTPFDLVEGESELVSGFNVEYSGYSFTLLFLSEYMNIWFMCLLSGLVFYSILSSLVSVWFSFLFVVLWIRSVLPRFKFNQLINLMWSIYLPLVFVGLFWVMLWLV